MALGFEISQWAKPSGGGGGIPLVAESAQMIDSGGLTGDSIILTFTSAPLAGQYILLIACSGNTSGTNILVTPAGFSLLFGDGVTYGVFGKVATGLEGATFTLSTFDEGGIVFGLRVSGVNATPIDQTGQNTSSANSPSVTTTVNNDLLLSIFISTTSVSAPTIPSGYVSLQTNSITGAHGGPLRMTAASSSQPTAGATGVAIWSLTASFAITLAIKP